MLKKVLFISSIIIAVISLYPYLHLLISVFNFPYNIYLDEGSHIRKALVFFSEGLKFNNLNEYPYFITIYGFLYELVVSPLLLIMEPSVNAGRIVTLASTVLIIFLLYKIIYKKTGSIYLSLIFSGTVIFLKLLAIYTMYSKNDMFLALLTLAVLYSLYFHEGKKQFIVTLIFTSLALMTKQTSVFIIPVVLSVWFINRKDMGSFIKSGIIWVSCIAAVFVILFLAIPNYYYNTIVISGQIGHITWSAKHMLFSQTIPLFRSCIIYFLLAGGLIFLNRKKGNKIFTPALLYILFYFPLFIWTSMSTGSMPVYYIFIVIGLSILIPEYISSYQSKLHTLVYAAVCLQLVIFLLFASQKYFFKFYYIEPTETESTENNEIAEIVKAHGSENSLVTFSWSSFGLSRQSAKYHFDFNHGYLYQAKLLNLKPYGDDFARKRFSVIIGGFEYPEVQEALMNNYYLYKVIGNTPVYLPK